MRTKEQTLVVVTGFWVFFAFVVSYAHSGQVQLSWNAPTKNADGTALTDLAGYTLYYGQNSRQVSGVYQFSVNIGNRNSYTLSGLTDGALYYFAVTASDTSENESAYSNEASGTASSPSPVPTGLVAAYGFSQGAGSTLTDATGQHHGTISGATWTSSGRYGKALNFDGSDDRVTIPDEPSLRAPSTAITVSLWVRPQASAGWATVIDKLHAGNYLSYAIGQNPGGTTRLSAYLQVNGTLIITPATSAMSTNTWYYTVLSWQSGQPLKLTLYRDNGTVFSQVMSPQSWSGAITYDAGPLRIAEDESGDNWAGRIDELRIYDRLLSSSELQADRQTPIP